jgi:hypothetical protein
VSRTGVWSTEGALTCSQKNEWVTTEAEARGLARVRLHPLRGDSL